VSALHDHERHNYEQKEGVRFGDKSGIGVSAALGSSRRWADAMKKQSAAGAFALGLKPMIQSDSGPKSEQGIPGAVGAPVNAFQDARHPFHDDNQRTVELLTKQDESKPLGTNLK
jgi:hypothetical protein